MCASFRVFSLNFEGDKLSPWPFFKGTIPIAGAGLAQWRGLAQTLKHDSNFFGHNNFCEENRGCTHIQGATNITYSTVVLIFDESGLS